MRLRSTLPLILLLASSASNAAHADVQAFVRTATGEVHFLNTGPASVDLSAYTIQSQTDSLLPLSWTPVAGRLDVAGDGSFDGSSSWVLLSTISGEVSEGAFSGPGGALPSFEPLSIGAAWDPAGSPDLEFTLNVDNAVVPPAAVTYTPPGDYDWDGDVDGDDYSVFVATFGSTTDPRADGNSNGIIDSGDYTVWRDALVTAVTPLSLALTIPEPAAIGMSFWGAVLLIAASRVDRRQPKGALAPW